MKKIIDLLFDMSDPDYKKFHSRLMPTVKNEKIIGVRVPHIRALAHKIYGTAGACEFMRELPHVYYEENNLHAFLIERIPNFDSCITELERFLPFIDNWATCDMLRPKVFAKNREKLLPFIYKWLSSEHTYTVRYGIEALMTYFLDDGFKTEYADAVAAVKGEDYYLLMMRAWYFATALAKQYSAIIPYIAEHRLDRATHNMAIKKAVESRRITAEQKNHLKSLRL